MSHYGDLCGIVSHAGTSESISVAVIDSLYGKDSSFSKSHQIGRTVDILPNEDSNDTTGHGNLVSHIIAVFADSIEFNFYRVTRSGGTVLQRDLMRAMGMAHNDEVDIMNISLGNDHSDDNCQLCDMPNEPCKIRDAAQQAINDGISIVAGAGNKPRFNTICCPALLDDVICVAGAVSKCTAREESKTDVMSVDSIYPPYSCWIKLADSEKEMDDQPLCSGLNCSADMRCDEYQENTSWSGNVESIDGKPDVYAPAAFPVETKNDPLITTGTSYATPIVTAAVAVLLTGLKNEDICVSPEEIRAAVSKTGLKLDEDGGNMIDSWQLVKRIYRHYDLHPPIRFQRYPYNESGF